MSVTEETRGGQLTGAWLEPGLRPVGDRRERAATRLLGAYRDGVWLRRFAVVQKPFNRPRVLRGEQNRPILDLTVDRPRIDWDAVHHLLADPCSWVRQAADGELAVLLFAASLVGPVPVSLESITQALSFSRSVDDDEDEDSLWLLQRALEEAVTGEEVRATAGRVRRRLQGTAAHSEPGPTPVSHGS
ncbi:hypothetical protein ACLF6K_06790 [Streptomyces xanthophaeus]|uniref:hypothetical protein n=1 Tax=Streptomyces xanthophaeus TaxID=67385 RepID=UPI00398FC1F4